MAAASAGHYQHGYEGLVIQPDNPRRQSSDIPGFRHYRASHPIPDERSVAAAEAALKLASGLEADDLLLVLLSGGGSALMSLPAAGLALQEKQMLTRQLLSCGATIEEINCVRKQLSAIKGGILSHFLCKSRLLRDVCRSLHHQLSAHQHPLSHRLWRAQCPLLRRKLPL